jgi:hypothetical protein
VGVVVGGLNDVFIMYNRKSDNAAVAASLTQWTSLQDAGQIANGVMLVNNSTYYVIAPTETTLTWSSANVTGGGTNVSEKIDAVKDMDGRSNTTAQLTHAECSDTAYAIGYCNSYTRTNANGKGLREGTWFLPSLGELLLIFFNKRKINYALSLIEGSTQLSEGWYWTSTERSSNYAWHLLMSEGYFNMYGVKTTDKKLVRPISTFTA